MNTQIELENLNINEALKYLGYKGQSADERTLKLISECEKKLLGAAVPKFVYRCFDVVAKEDGIHVEGTNMILPGKSIAQHLEGCEKAVFMCATVGAGVDRLLRVLELEDMTSMVIMDSLASVAVEQVCAKAESVIAGEFKEFYQTWRFGIGYGDLPLTLQGDFIKAVNADKRIGVCATSTSLLTPRKSVTCIIGLSKTSVKKSRRGCATCNMRECCAYAGTEQSCANR